MVFRFRVHYLAALIVAAATAGSALAANSKDVARAKDRTKIAEPAPISRAPTFATASSSSRS
jgi:hypothetical protein